MAIGGRWHQIGMALNPREEEVRSHIRSLPHAAPASGRVPSLDMTLPSSQALDMPDPSAPLSNL